MGFFGFLKKKPHDELTAPVMPEGVPAPPGQHLQKDLGGALPPLHDEEGQALEIDHQLNAQELGEDLHISPDPAPNAPEHMPAMDEQEYVDANPIAMEDSVEVSPPDTTEMEPVDQPGHHIPQFSKDEIEAAIQMEGQEPADWSETAGAKEQPPGPEDWSGEGVPPPPPEPTPPPEPAAPIEDVQPAEKKAIEEAMVAPEEPPAPRLEEAPKPETMVVDEKLPAFDEEIAPPETPMRSLYINAVAYRDALNHIKAFGKGVRVGDTALDRMTEGMSEHKIAFESFAEKLNDIEQELMRMDSVLATGR